MRYLFSLAVCVPLAFATDISDPVKFVSDVYTKYIGSDRARKPYQAPTHIYSPRLSKLLDEDKRKANDEVGCIEFDFWLNGQDASIRKPPAVSAKPSTRADQQTVIATFVNIRTPMELQFDFVRIGGKWLLDDVHSLKGERWTLSKLLMCSP
jgi:hypothetical protein